MIPTLNGVATVEKIAINAVGAGCTPEYLPVVITAIEAQGGQTNTHPGAHLMILHGLMRKALDLNCRTGVLGHSWRTNDA